MTTHSTSTTTGTAAAPLASSGAALSGPGGGVGGAGHHPPKESVKETLISVIIAFVLAFVFRGFVVEAFVIPTGSMAPTLMGQHMRFQSEENGVPWAVGPWDYVPGTQDALPVQGARPDAPVIVHDPRTGELEERRNVTRLAGDRILVLKYLYALNEPQRYDVVVFKNPGDPSVNYIKRLIGLPGEEIALVDGDVFVRRPTSEKAGPATWEEPGWTIARKGNDVARAVWQNVFDSSLTPLSATGGAAGGGSGASWFSTPWKGAGWATEGKKSFEYTSAGPARLDWDSSRVFAKTPQGNMLWEINDRYAYNETFDPAHRPLIEPFPVGDIRLRANVDLTQSPESPVPVISAIVFARGHEFRAVLEGTTARVEMRPAAPGRPGAAESNAPWTTLAKAECPALSRGTVTPVEFWHIDQRLTLFVNGKKVVSGDYDWTPAERIRNATGLSLAELMQRDPRPASQLTNPLIYRRSGAAWTFSGGPVTLHHVALDRDLFYCPAARNQMQSPATATHPITTLFLKPDQFFVCGDNSPQSEDGRLWLAPDPWVAREIDATPGIVPRDLLLGKAFFVYFPALAGSDPIPMPDFGRLRWIR